MKATQLPKYIDPIALATKKSFLKGSLQLADMERLKNALYDREGEVIIDLAFAKDEEGWRYIRGRIQTDLKLLCQRCLLPMEYKMDIPISLSPVSDAKAAKDLPERYEALEISAEPLALLNIVEDEILLNLPLVAKHGIEKCSVKLQNEVEKGDNSNPRKDD